MKLFRRISYSIILIFIGFYCFALPNAGAQENVYVAPVLVQASEHTNYAELAVYNPLEFDADDDPNTFNYLPEVKNQGKFGLCWAYAILGSVEIELSKNYGIDYAGLDLAEKYLAYFAKNGYDTNEGSPTYHDGKQNTLDDIYRAGGSFEWALHALLSGMGLHEQDYADFTTTGSLALYLGSINSAEKFEPYRYGDVAVVNGYQHYTGDTPLDYLKSVIVDKGSLVVSVKMENPGNFLNEANSCYYSYYSEGISQSDHMIEIVGWDDNFSANNFGVNKPSSDGAWLIRNSWGSSWCNYGGYAWVSYEDYYLHNFGYYSIDVEPYNVNDVLYQYDLGANTCVKIGNGAEWYDVKAGNVYRNNSPYEQKIRAVGYYVFDMNNSDLSQNAVIQVYKSNSPMSNPEKGSRVVTINDVERTYGGYYKVELPSEITISAGEYFSVVVTMKSSNCAPMMCVEGKTDNDAGRYANSSAGQSYLFLNSNWHDMSVEYSDYNNACLKVYARYTVCETHSYGEYENHNATCSEKANKTRVCEICGFLEKVVDNESSLLPHSYEPLDHIPASDCLHDGYDREKCSVCGDIQSINHDGVFGEHNVDENHHIAGDCQNYGYHTWWCVVCDSEIDGGSHRVYDDYYGEHSYKEIGRTTADCCHYAIKHLKCEVCGDEQYQDDEAGGYGEHHFGSGNKVGNEIVFECDNAGCGEQYIIDAQTEEFAKIDATNLSKIYFEYKDISYCGKKDLVIKMKNGTINVGKDIFGELVSASKIEIDFLKYTFDEVKNGEMSEISDAFKDSHFYKIVILVDGNKFVWGGGEEIKISLNKPVQGCDLYDIYTPIPAGVKLVENQRRYSGDTISISIGECGYLVVVPLTGEEHKNTWPIKKEYVFVIIGVVAILVLSEGCAKAKKRRKEE